MSTSQIQFIIGAYNDEVTIWITILILVLVAGGVGIWNFIRKKQQQFQEGFQEDYYPSNGTQWKWQFSKTSPEKKISAPEKAVPMAAAVVSQTEVVPEKPQAKKKHRDADLQSGMELLELDFLVKLASDISHDENTDLAMHRLAFDEIARRQKLSELSGKILKVYAVNKGNFFSKVIQRQALEEMALRTKLKV